MSEQVTGELKKLADIATDPALDADIRMKSMQQISRIATYDALVALLDLAANEQLPVKERDAALKHARDVLKKAG